MSLPLGLIREVVKLIHKRGENSLYGNMFGKGITYRELIG